MTHPYLYTGLTQQGQLLARVGFKSSDPYYIISAVADVVRISQPDMLGKLRKREFVEARCIAIGLILKVNPKFGLKNLGKLFSRDHSTMVYQRDLFEDLYKRDKPFTAKVAKILDII